jgi:nucleoid DNA-binding protein
MNKATLIEFVAEECSISKKGAKVTVETVLEGITNGLVDDGVVTLVGFGTFSLVQKQARTARNPKTGEEVDVPAKVVPKFRPSAALKEVFADVTLNSGAEVAEDEE